MMTPAARSLHVFGLDLIGAGALLLLAPALLLVFGAIDLAAAGWAWLALRSMGTGARLGTA